jgi:hypothetical protein
MPSNPAIHRWSYDQVWMAAVRAFGSACVLGLCSRNGSEAPKAAQIRPPQVQDFNFTTIELTLLS